jgi:hypothetical protein
MQDTKGNLDNTTTNKLVWCAMQCTLIKKKKQHFFLAQHVYSKYLASMIIVYHFLQ